MISKRLFNNFFPILLTILFLAFFSWLTVAHAAGDDLLGVDLSIERVFNIISGFACWLWSVSMLLLVIAVIIVGLRFVTARDNQDLFAKAKTTFGQVILGAIVIMGAYVIIATVAYNVGADISLVPFRCHFSSSGSSSSQPPSIPDITPPPGGPAGGSGLPTGGGSPNDARCSDLARLAIQYNEPYPARNAPELGSLIQCIRRALPNEDLGTIFTTDLEHPTCNYTRGQTICDTRCSHAVNSCHYGGRTGTTGARAVNFGNETIATKIIDVAKGCGAKTARCENASGPSSCTTATHVYVNTSTCDVN